MSSSIGKNIHAPLAGCGRIVTESLGPTQHCAGWQQGKWAKVLAGDTALHPVSLAEKRHGVAEKWLKVGRPCQDPVLLVLGFTFEVTLGSGFLNCLVILIYFATVCRGRYCLVGHCCVGFTLWTRLQARNGLIGCAWCFPVFLWTRAVLFRCAVKRLKVR